MTASDKTKVALVTPPVTEKVADHPLFPPLGLAHTAAVLKQNNVEVTIIDSPVLNYNHQNLKSELEAFQPTNHRVGSITPTIESFDAHRSQKKPRQTRRSSWVDPMRLSLISKFIQ